MNTQLAQLVGMTKYEFRMHWRRKTLLFIFLTLLGITVGVAATASATEIGKLIQLFVREQGLVTATDLLTMSILFATSSPLAFALAIILPIVVSDTIPLDKQGGVRELLDSLPLSPTVYLGGKVLGMWCAVISSVVIGAAVTATAWWLSSGTYHVGAYLEMWLMSGIALTILNGSLGVLLAAGQPNRIRAMVLILILLFVTMVFAGNSFVAGEKPSLAASLNPLRSVIIMRYTDSIVSFNFFTPAIAITVAVGLVQLVIVWLLVWGWLRRREHIA